MVYVDEDEKIDKTLYVVSRYYNGTLRIVNQEFTPELLLPKSQKSEFLSGQLKDMVRYFLRFSSSYPIPGLVQSMFSETAWPVNSVVLIALMLYLQLLQVILIVFQLSRLYSSSPALGRYFVNAGLNSFR